MAANFWLSKHSKKWVKPAGQVEAIINLSPDRQYLSPLELFGVKYYYCHLIQNTARKINLSQKVVALSSVFFRRLYFKRSFSDFDPNLFSVACLYLSSKLEECALHQGQADVIIHAVKMIVEDYIYDVEDLLSAEYYLLEELEFDLIVFHPYQPLLEYLVDAKLESSTETIWSIMNDTYKQTDICLMYPPHVITLACMFVAAMHEGRDVFEWFATLNTDMRLIGEAAANITKGYEIFEDVNKNIVQNALAKVKERAPSKASKPAYSGVRSEFNVKLSTTNNNNNMNNMSNNNNNMNNNNNK